MKNWRVAPGQHATFWHCENLCILHTLLGSGYICTSMYWERSRKQRTKQLVLLRIQKQRSLIPMLFHYAGHQEKRRKKNSAGIWSVWNILGGIQIRSEYFLWLCHLANSESILSPCNPQAEMGLVWSEIAWWKHALLCDFAWFCNQISQ